MKNVSLAKEEPIELNGGTFAVLKSLDDFKIGLSSETFFGDEKNTPANTYYKTQLCASIARNNGSNALSLVFGVPEKFDPKTFNELLAPENYLEFAKDFFVLKNYNWLKEEGKQQVLPSSIAAASFYNSWPSFSVLAKTLGFEPGTYSIVFTANCNNGIEEFAELKANNTAGTTIQIAAVKESCNGSDDDLNGKIDDGCDIGIEKFSLADKVNSALCSENASVVVKNFGTIESVPVKIGLFEKFPAKDSIALQEKLVPALAPNESIAIEFSQH